QRNSSRKRTIVKFTPNATRRLSLTLALLVSSIFSISPSFVSTNRRAYSGFENSSVCLVLLAVSSTATKRTESCNLLRPNGDRPPRKQHAEERSVTLNSLVTSGCILMSWRTTHPKRSNQHAVAAHSQEKEIHA